MQDTTKDNESTCPVCGKPTVKRDVRDKEPRFCSRVCSANMRYRTRYRGSMAGPKDRPKNWKDKTKFKG